MNLPKNGWGGSGTKVANFQHKGYGRLLTEQLIIGLNDGGMINEILKEVATLEDIEDVTRKHVLM